VNKLAAEIMTRESAVGRRPSSRSDLVINFGVMAANKKAKKTPKKKAGTAKPSPKNRTPQKTTRKKSIPKKSAKKKASKRRTASRKFSASRPASSKPRPRAKKQVRFSDFSGSRRAQAQSGDADSQGLSTIEGADSESVSELLEEGNAFEAGVLTGVERADDADEREVRARQFPEDDVPQEYLDKD